MRAIQQTLQVTKAMDLISTSKLRKGRRVLQDIEPFFNRIQKSMFDILSGAGNFHSNFFVPLKRGNEHHTAVIVVTSDKGLAGGYNANIFRHITQLCSKMEKPMLILVGAIGYRYFVHSPYVILENFSFKSQLPDIIGASEISEYIISQYLSGMFDEVYIAYTHMFNSIKILPVDLQLLPLNLEKMQEEFTAAGQKRVELSFEYLPSRHEVFDALVPFYIKGVIYGALIEAYASEQSARMAAMDEASKNAEEMLANLRIYYNRVRQAGITQEMSEIIGGSAALE